MLGSYLPTPVLLPLPIKETPFGNSSACKKDPWAAGAGSSGTKGARSSVVGGTQTRAVRLFKFPPGAGTEACNQFRFPAVVTGGLGWRPPEESSFFR